MAEYMGKVMAVKEDETIEVSLYSGGYKTRQKVNKATGIPQNLIVKGPNGRPVRKFSGLKLQFFWSDVKNGPVRVGDTVMVEMQPVSRPVRKV